MEPIIVVVEDGMVVDVRGIPPGQSVEVWDYDCEGPDDEEATQDDQGQWHWTSTYGSEGNCPYCLNAPDQGHMADCERPL